jgi:hypothetical protein
MCVEGSANEVFRMVEQDAILRMVAGSTGFCLTTA